MHPVVLGSALASALGVGMTVSLMYLTRSEQLSSPSSGPASLPGSPVLPSSSRSLSAPSECTLHYNNVGWGPGPELYVKQAGVQYFRQIDGKDIGELVNKLQGGQ